MCQYCVSPPEGAVCHYLSSDAAAGGTGLTHHRAQTAVYPLDKRPEEARLSLYRYRHTAVYRLL